MRSGYAGSLPVADFQLFKVAVLLGLLRIATPSPRRHSGYAVDPIYQFLFTINFS
jgi:hypothetical protein